MRSAGGIEKVARKFWSLCDDEKNWHKDDLLDIAKQYVVEEHVTSQSVSPRVQELVDVDGEGGDGDMTRTDNASTTTAVVETVSMGLDAMAISDIDCFSTAQVTQATVPSPSDTVELLSPSLNALTIDTTATLTPTPTASELFGQEQERQRLVLESKRLFKQQMTAPRPPQAPNASITTLWDDLLPTTTTANTDPHSPTPTPENTSEINGPLGQAQAATPSHTASYKRPETFFWSEELDLRLADYTHKYDLNYDKISRKLQLMYKLQLLNDDQRKMLYSIMYTNGVYDSMSSDSNSNSRFPLSPSSFDAASADSDALEAAITQLTSTTTDNNSNNNNAAIHTAALFLSADACRIRWYQLNPHLWSSSSTATDDDNNTDPAHIANSSHTTHLNSASTKPNFSIFAKPDKTAKGHNYDRNSAPTKVKTFDMLLQQSNNNDEDEEEDDEGDETPARTTNQPQPRYHTTPTKSSPSLPAYLTRPVALPSMSDDDDDSDDEGDADESTAAIGNEHNSSDNNSHTNDNNSGCMDQEDDEEEEEGDAFPTPSQDGGSDSDKAMSTDSDILLYTLD